MGDERGGSRTNATAKGAGRLVYLGGAGPDDGSRDGQEVTYVSGPGDVLPGDLRTHWETWGQGASAQAGYSSGQYDMGREGERQRDRERERERER